MSSKEKDRYELYSDYKHSFFCSFIRKQTIKARNNFFKYFIENTDYTIDKSVIDIGTTPSLDDENNVFLAHVKDNKNVSCLSNQDCSILKKKYTNIKDIFIGHGQNMKLEDNSFDISHSNAVIEHIGSYENQISLIKDMTRISKNYVFIQTPNRYYPIEFHTNLPFIHWLPKNMYHKLLRLFKLEFYSKEENLNLLTKKDLIKICDQLNLRKFKIIEHKLLFLTSHLVLVIEK